MSKISDMGAQEVLALLRPRSVAIVGASDKSRWSRAVFDNLTLGGFGGQVHLVNRRGGMVHERSVASRCADLGVQVDLGVMLVPALAAEQAIDDLAAVGARMAVVLTSGFAETGAAGEALQRALVVAARRHAIRLLGPNTLGFVNFAARTRVWTTPLMPQADAGSGVAIISQSGATAYFLSDLADRQGVALSYVVATGNEADLDCSTILEALVEDEATQAIALFIESIRDPAHFVRAAARALTVGKPIVVLKVGASETTARSALAHTGALVGDDRIFAGICRQFGLIRVHAIEDLLATADIAARTGMLGQGGLCVVSNSGGICEIAADTAEMRGVALPEVSAGVADSLRGTIPGFATPHNPLDLTGGISPEQCGEAVRLMADQPGVAAVLCPWYEVPTTEPQVNDRLMQSYTHLAQALNAAAVPGFLVSYTATSINAMSRDIIARTRLPYLACGLDRALTGLAGAMWWADRRRQHPGASAPADLTAAEQPRSERAMLAYLARHDVPVVPASLACDEAQAVALAAAIVGPVVLKIASPDIAHKSDIGGVVLDLIGVGAVAAGFRQVVQAAATHAPSARIEGVLVAPMRPRGIELFVGYARDAQWGPVLTVGLGGIWVEVMQDVALRLLPVDAAEIRRMLNELRGARMLAGQRGVPAADLDRVAEVIAGIGRAALGLGPSLAALDVNPLWVRGGHVEVLDALPVWDDDRPN